MERLHYGGSHADPGVRTSQVDAHLEVGDYQDEGKQNQEAAASAARGYFSPAFECEGRWVFETIHPAQNEGFRMPIMPVLAQLLFRPQLIVVLRLYIFYLFGGHSPQIVQTVIQDRITALSLPERNLIVIYVIVRKIKEVISLILLDLLNRRPDWLSLINFFLHIDHG